MEEVRFAAFSLGAHKAPKADGFRDLFFHKYWEVVHGDVFKMVANFFQLGEFPLKLNNTNIVLVAKQKHYVFLGDY